MRTLAPETDAGFAGRLLDAAGGGVDHLFLALPRILKRFKPVRNIDRHTYASQVAFYFDEGYVKQPETFFDLPRHLPDYTIAKRRPYHGGECQLITYESGYVPRNPLLRDAFHAFETNRTGWIVRWTHGASGRKTVLCLHGYMLGEPRQARRMFRVRRLFEMGLDVALFITPFHWRRAPANPALRGIFLQPDDVAMTCECFGQAMHDLQLALTILEDMGAGKTGLIGASLGGYNTALFAGLSDRPAFAALIVPAVNFTKPFGPGFIQLPFPVDAALRKRLEQVWQLHSPLNFTPRLSREKLLVIASRGDRLCPFGSVQSLWEQWNRPRHRFMTGGHWLVFNPRARGEAWYGFLRDQGFIS